MERNESVFGAGERALVDCTCLGALLGCFHVVPAKARRGGGRAYAWGEEGEEQQQHIRDLEYLLVLVEERDGGGDLTVGNIITYYLLSC